MIEFWMGTDGTKRLRLTVRGTVQGVGMRPRVHSLATGLGLSGFIANTEDGVVIEVEGRVVAGFEKALREVMPPLARIESIEAADIPLQNAESFEIRDSVKAQAFALVPPDTATCPACIAEFNDPADRRYRYPFINCTDCGPRYSITVRIPYDRPNTTMSGFLMCAECEAEYRDPSSRRFHAEPNACPACGPRLTLMPGGPQPEGHGGLVKIAGDALEEAVCMLQEGRIVAVKGIGGFHLACDAMNPGAVRTLRERKRRSNKPFALMARDIETIRGHCEVSDAEAGVLLSAARPIVLLKRGTPSPLPEAVAPGAPYLGFMLPYAPLHHLLLERIPVLVMTSANLAEEPIVIDNEDAVSRLGGICDAFLLHDRQIFMRCDDSVVRVTGRGETLMLRRARGFVPSPIMLREGGPDVLAAGAELKNTLALTAGRMAVVSQHIGDMENIETLEFFEETLRNLKAAYGAAPVALGHDLHPGYLSTRWALRQKLRPIAVQHHHSHVASVMAEHGLGGRGLGIVLDGAGYGTDGTLWGGEFLVTDGAMFERAGHLLPVPLPGGDTAVREPWRMAVSYMHQSSGRDEAATIPLLQRLGYMDRYGETLVRNVLTVCAIAIPSSGTGRLFDAVAALSGVCDRNTFEGEAPIALTAAAMRAWGRPHGPYPYSITGSAPAILDFSTAIAGIINDRLSHMGRDEIAARFHRTVIDAVVALGGRIYGSRDLRWAALSGGSFQNPLLLDGVREGLEALGIEVHINERVPLNDGGISLGQAYIAREVLKQLAP